MRLRTTVVSATVSALIAAGLVAMVPAAATAAPSPAPLSGPPTEYVVLVADGAARSGALAAISRSGGRVVAENAAAGSALVVAPAQGFADRVSQEASLAGAARNRPIGQLPAAGSRDRGDVERLTAERAAAARSGDAGGAGDGKRDPSAEPFAGLQWDMAQIGATAQGSYATERGSRKVMVGVIDTGIDGSHPDLAANFDAKDSRNFTTDIPAIDGPCEYANCKDPANVDDNEHGTHVASTIGSPLNGLGMAGVAPNITLVNIRAGQDSGYFFLQPTLDALTYAGDLGVDVVNMSYYVDPWLYNCPDNPADSPAAQQEQRTIVKAVQRAADYARSRGVTLVAAAGNESTDLGHKTFDDTSPDYPPGTSYPRTVDNSCISVPGETGGVITVTATGPSTRKSYYSNYGVTAADVAAPGGDAFDSPDNRLRIASLVLAAYPEHLARERGELNHDGTPATPFVLRDCRDGTCAYYQYLQGTSMAAPHAVGVAALIVSRYGHADTRHRSGLTLEPGKTTELLYETATAHACPEPRTYTYTLVRSSGTSTRTAYCEGSPERNGFYGHGIVSALRAVAGDEGRH